MTPETFYQQFATFADVPNGIANGNSNQPTGASPGFHVDRTNNRG